MITNEDIDDFIEHFGKKGMRWGQRSGKQKIKIALGGAITGGVAAHLIMRKTMNWKFADIGGVAAVGVGAVLAGKILDRNRNKRIERLAISKANKEKVLK